MSTDTPASTISLHRRIAAAVAAFGAGVGVAAAQPEPPVYVDDDAPAGGDGKSWETAFNNIRDAMDLVNAISYSWERPPIHIAEGVYDVAPFGGDPAYSFQPNSAVTLMGGWGTTGASNPAGSRWTHDPARFVTVIDGGRGTASTVDDTHVIIQPRADSFGVSVQGVVFRNARRSVIELVEGSTLSLLDCRFEDLQTTRSAIKAWTARALVVDGCTFTGTTSTYAVVGASNTEHVLIRRSRFIDNRTTQSWSDGGAISIRGAESATIEDCEFVANHTEGEGGAICLGSGIGEVVIWFCQFRGNSAAGDGGALSVDTMESDSAIRWCTFENNHSQGHGGAASVSGWENASIENCLFVGNSAVREGGALASHYVSVANCTFVGNHSEGDHAGALEASGSDWDYVANCILWGNTTASPASPHAQVRADDVLVEDNIIQGASDASNLNLDPRFVSSADFRLLPDSPAINLGNRGRVRNDHNLDLDFRPRIAGLFVDAGCYEADSPAPCGQADLTTHPTRGLPGYRLPDGRVTSDDFYVFLDAYTRGNASADLTRTTIQWDPYFGVPDGIISHTDFYYYLLMYERGCE